MAPTQKITKMSNALSTFRPQYFAKKYVVVDVELISADALRIGVGV